ncbi:hypothetical protein BSF44_52750 [Pseudomonas sp. ACN8]|nr:hypothetical protein BSF44_52750 [Pseudomonas sp. ACN8]
MFNFFSNPRNVLQWSSRMLGAYRLNQFPARVVA